MKVNRFHYTARVLLLGLFAAQVIATVQVYFSNADLYHTLVTVRDAGYLAIPNQRVMHSLQEFKPALLGGLFFTFSVGAGLSVLSLTAAWVWERLVSREKFLLILFLLLWVGCLIALNRRGFCPIVTSYFLFIPPLVFFATLRWMPPRDKQRLWLNTIVDFVPIILLAFLWAPQMNKQFFLEFRDHMLLSNPVGTKINGFYYDYNLYAAEAFKSLDQKILKTCDLERIEKESLVTRMERELLRRDYLHVGKDGAVDLKVAQEGNTLVFENRRRMILRTTFKDFFSGSEALLREFSSKSDRHAFFRKFTYFSLLIGFPITLYVILYALFRLELSFFLSPPPCPPPRRGRGWEGVIASILCLFIGLALLFTFHHLKGRNIEVEEIADALKSKRWQDRVVALKIIEQRGIEIADFQAYKRMLKSPHIPERYWLARALGVSRKSQTYKHLLAFLEDSHPVVVSKAFYALGQRGDRWAVKEIIERIERSDDWDNQWYAYKALRALGWSQKKSK